MNLGMEVSIILAYAFGLVILYVIGYILLFPIKIMLRLLVNSILGGVVLFLLNAVGQYIDFHIPINIITAIIVGILGIPGIAMITFLVKIIF